ncbi:MAG: hypothetical protein ACR2NP_11430 [Pirellulaceae bacterium]
MPAQSRDRTNTSNHDGSTGRSATQKIATTAGSLSAMFLASTASAHIVYVDDQPFELALGPPVGTVISWDVDGQGGAEFQLALNGTTRRWYLAPWNYYLRQTYLAFGSNTASGNALNGRGLVGGPGATWTYGVQPLPYGVTIGPTLQGDYVWQSYRSAGVWSLHSIYRRRYGLTQQVSFRVLPGPVFNEFVQQHFDEYAFTGFQFVDDNGDLHYGWAEIRLSGYSVEISRWAYETDADVGIQVGEIPEPVSPLALLGTGAAGLIRWRRKQKPQLLNPHETP